MKQDPKPGDWLSPKTDAHSEERQWAAIERGLESASFWQRLAFWRRLWGDVVPGAPFYARPAFALALAALLVVGGAAFVLRSARLGSSSDVAHSPTSASAPLVLADGSTVHLEPGTELGTPTNEPMEIVAVLAKGTADFDVVPNRQRTFTVVADGVEVRVVGTGFRVATDPATHRTTVSVDHGIVEVRADVLHGEVRRLTAGQAWSTEDAAALPAGGATTAPSASAAPASSSSSEAPSSEGLAAPDSSAGATSTGSSSPPAADEARALYESANRARRAGDVARAESLYRELLRKHPDDARAQVAALELARLEMEKGGDSSEAERALETASSANAGSSVHEDALARLVELYAKKGDLAACKKAKAQYLASYPQGVHAAQVRSRCASP